MSLNRIPLSFKILFTMALGLTTGGISQTNIQALGVLADTFVTLLQMTALPYIALSLIVGIGGLSPLQAGKAFKQSLLALLLLLFIALMFIFVTPLAFPNWPHADFYSPGAIKAPDELDLIALLVPANPFYALAHTVIPAVVLFSIFVGIGLMSVKGKRHTLSVLTSLQAAVANISNMVMRFAPIGVFCIAYRAAVTIEVSQIDGLLVYIVSSTLLVLLLSFAVLPATVALLTPFSYRQLVKAFREAMVTAFATGSFFIVIPVLIEKTKALLAHTEAISQADNNRTHIEKIPGILIPISFSLPVGGKLLAILFTLFAAWFSGAYIGSGDYAMLLIAGLPQLFGTSTLAMPKLLELFNVSASMFDFFIVAENLITGRLSALLSVSFATCLPLLLACLMSNTFRLNWRYLGRNLVIIPMVSLALFLTLRFGFNEIGHQYQGYDNFINRDFLYPGVNSRYLTQAQEQPLNARPFTSVLTRIRQRGFIRVGYFRDDLPYAFHNGEGKLVGFDIEIMNLLATDLQVDIEFVKIYHHQAAQLLASGYLDITSGIPVIPDNLREFTLTAPYSQQSLAFLVKDERRSEFVRWQDITAREDLTIGIPETFFYQNAVQRHFTCGKAWEIASPRLFFREKYRHIDAMLYGAAAASAWTLLYPDYTVIAPKPVLPPLAMAFPINKNDQEFELFMRNWIAMKKQNNSLENLFDYWIGGKSPQDIPNMAATRPDE
ncbi:cation:dicarboxylase symporter family transporter [Thalassomonas viridans]|uniref:Cation:dicarboxylase symporter family transporter n=1 Tax=Thalassomonas viridans TaxID=137584 RepID=A0AAE9YZ88_9GAMM|nr:cation:dicarboxylase symporter family transporter [Thalassomonas viridans]WDE03109.1 cation:dicarboxylase symporter family transporter [Thalassomonas viridans]